MISERANDGIKRSREQWFKRYNSKEPEKGRARKSMATRPKDWLEQTRKDWADHANQALARAGSRERAATAQAVEDGNLELKSDREEVEKMEGMLWRAHALAAQVAKQLAGYVRDRLERSRGRSGPDHGWSR